MLKISKQLLSINVIIKNCIISFLVRAREENPCRADRHDNIYVDEQQSCKTDETNKGKKNINNNKN